MKPFWKKQKPTDISVLEPVAEPQLPLESEPQPEVSIETPKRPEPNRRRSEILKLRLTQEEFDYITEQAKLAQMSKTDYLLKVAHDRPAVVIEDIPALLVELRRQGVNLNQLTRLAHQTQSTDLPQIEEVLISCELAQNSLLDLCAEWDIKLRKK